MRLRTKSDWLYDILIYMVLLLLTAVCLLPLVNVVAVSLSSKAAAAGNLVGLLPVDLTFASYAMLLNDTQFWRSFMISVTRVIMGTAINMLLIVMMAYPLSKSKHVFGARNVYMNLLICAMLFSGGLIPTYMTVNGLHLTDTIWSLVLPGAVPIFSVILMINFFKGIPQSLEEAAEIDGCTPWGILFRIFVPVSLPALATISLFCVVGHWNDFFSGLIYMNKTSNYPLQTYIQQLNIDITKVTDPTQLKGLAEASNKTLNSAKIVVSTIPLLLIYPFLQKYFVKGIVIGSVKE